jgi:hypothetical protein
MIIPIYSFRVAHERHALWFFPTASTRRTFPQTSQVPIGFVAGRSAIARRSSDARRFVRSARPIPFSIFMP